MLAVVSGGTGWASNRLLSKVNLDFDLSYLREWAGVVATNELTSLLVSYCS